MRVYLLSSICIGLMSSMALAGSGSDASFVGFSSGYNHNSGQDFQNFNRTAHVDLTLSKGSSKYEFKDNYSQANEDNTTDTEFKRDKFSLGAAYNHAMSGWFVGLTLDRVWLDTESKNNGETTDYVSFLDDIFLASGVNLGSVSLGAGIRRVAIDANSGADAKGRFVADIYQPEISVRVDMGNTDLDIAYRFRGEKKTDVGTATDPDAEDYTQLAGSVVVKAAGKISNELSVLGGMYLYEYNRKANENDTYYEAKLSAMDYIAPFVGMGYQVNPLFTQHVGFRRASVLDSYEGSFTGHYALQTASTLNFTPMFNGSLLLSYALASDKKELDFGSGAKLKVRNTGPEMVYGLQFGGSF